MTTDHERDLDFVPGVLLGGPLDGQRYMMPLLPPGSKEPPTGVRSPLRVPHETSPRAEYALSSNVPIGGYYVYLFDKLTDTNGEDLADVRDETCHPEVRHAQRRRPADA